MKISARPTTLHSRVDIGGGRIKCPFKRCGRGVCRAGASAHARGSASLHSGHGTTRIGQSGTHSASAAGRRPSASAPRARTTERKSSRNELSRGHAAPVADAGAVGGCVGPRHRPLPHAARRLPRHQTRYRIYKKKKIGPNYLKFGVGDFCFAICSRAVTQRAALFSNAQWNQAAAHCGFVEHNSRLYCFLF
jgi:hypothetical protein